MPLAETRVSGSSLMIVCFAVDPGTLLNMILTTFPAAVTGCCAGVIPSAYVICPVTLLLLLINTIGAGKNDFSDCTVTFVSTFGSYVISSWTAVTGLDCGLTDTSALPSVPVICKGLGVKLRIVCLYGVGVGPVATDGVVFFGVGFGVNTPSEKTTTPIITKLSVSKMYFMGLLFFGASWTGCGSILMLILR